MSEDLEDVAPPARLYRLGRAPDPDDDSLPAGVLDRGWLARRRMGVAIPTGRFVDIGHSRSLALLRRRLPTLTLDHGVTELDAAAIRLSAPRALTQRLSRYVYEQTDADGHRRFAGIRYPSRLGDDFENWAIFEPAELNGELEDSTGLIHPEDPDLIGAMRLHRIQWNHDPPRPSPTLRTPGGVELADGSASRAHARRAGSANALRAHGPARVANQRPLVAALRTQSCWSAA